MRRRKTPKHVTNDPRAERMAWMNAAGAHRYTRAKATDPKGVARYEAKANAERAPIVKEDNA